ncbi:MAG: fasciclin domain-containing protein [Halanaerobium sp.]
MYTVTEIEASNGVIHVIDTVLVPLSKFKIKYFN